MILENKGLTNKEYFKVAIPFMLSTLTQPILGAVDTAVVGQLSSSIFIGGVSIGVVIFNTIYWLFGFLRVSTTSYSAQAMGDKYNKLKAFIHPLIMAIIIGVMLVLLQNIIWKGYVKIISSEELVMEQAYIYYSLLIWGAPVVLTNYVILGWLMGQSKVKESVIMQVCGNLINIILDVLLVKVFGLKVDGVAIATLTSQVFTLFLGIFFMVKFSEFKIKEIFNREIFNRREILNKLYINTDFIIRTICLLIVNNIFTATSSNFGTAILAANTIILQLESILSYLFEGLANATSIFIGRSIGKKNFEMYSDTVNLTFKYSLLLSTFLTIIYILFRGDVIFLFTNIEEVIQTVKVYDFWIILYPTVACLSLTLYGVFSGAMETKAIRNSTFLSMILFVFMNKLLVDKFSNHGLWLSFIVYYLARTIFLLIYLVKLNNNIRNKREKN